MSKRGLPTGVQMRHDYHYVEELTRSNRPVGKIIPIDRIYPNPEQPRVEFGDLTELTESIREKGVLEPLLVKPTSDGRYMIIAGERRFRASNLAGLDELPCIELDIDNESVAEIALIENLQRKDLTIWEEADGLKALADKFGYTQDQIAKKISKSRTTVTELMTVAGLPAEIRAKCRKLDINSKSALLEVARQFDDQAMSDFLDNFRENQKAKNGQPKPKESTANKTFKGAVRAQQEDSVFTFSPEDAGFTLELKFTDPSEKSKRNILYALKQAFESVKSSPDAE